MKTPSEQSIKLVRSKLLGRTSLVGEGLRAALTQMYDGWLTNLMPRTDGIALLAVGGLGRREPTPFGDLDLVLLHTGRVSEISAVADELWYPVWDADVGLDHSVRTVDEALSVANHDLKAMLGMLDARHVAGDPALTGLLREQVITRWRRTAPGRLAELQELSRARWAVRGDASFLLEPDLKNCRGGLRDWVGLRALASAQLVDLAPAVIQASALLLDVRGELHRMAERNADVLRSQDRSTVATALGSTDGDAVLRAVNQAARTLGFATDAAWRRVAAAHTAAPRSWLRRLRLPVTPELSLRQPLAQDVVTHSGEVVLARDADPWADPVLVLRVARAAAQYDLPISTYALTRLSTESSPMPIPWPAAARNEFVTLLDAGQRAIAALEALDQYGLLSGLIPEWESVRFKAQHNPVHKFTVDRHLIETAVRASALGSEVARPDLLLMGALLHDIGKGSQGDHSEVGARIARTIALRMGFNIADSTTIAYMARHHLLLPNTATRRDLEDPSTVNGVIAAISGSSELLDLLHCLAIADAAATGPGAWSDWKASLISQLVSRTRAVLGGEPISGAEPPPKFLLALAGKGGTQVVMDGSDVIVVAPDQPGLLSLASGLLALHSLDVRAADVRTINGMAVNRFTVAPRFGQFPALDLLHADLRRVLAKTLALEERLLAKEATYDSAAQAGGIPRLLWFDDVATDATILEVRARDRIGLLHRVTSALEDCGVDIRSARISSLGAHVVDAFYLAGADGKALSEERQSAVTERVSAALAS
jgi:[protein-PII] uridylyltransferase